MEGLACVRRLASSERATGPIWGFLGLLDIALYVAATSLWKKYFRNWEYQIIQKKKIKLIQN